MLWEDWKTRAGVQTSEKTLAWLLIVVSLSSKTRTQPHSDPVYVLLLNCNVPCDRAQSSVSLWLVCPFRKCMGGNGFVEKDNFFCDSILSKNTVLDYAQFQQPLFLIWMDPHWGLFFPGQDLLALEVTSFLLCPYFPSGRLLFLFVVSFLAENMSEVPKTGVVPCVFRAWDLSLTWCLFLGLFWVELWFLAPTASWWGWAAPRWLSCCATWWSVSSQLKTSLPDARLHCGVTL